jgi:hypothetical protein
VEQTSRLDADSAGPEVAAAVHAMHRRDGWTRATITSFIVCLFGLGGYLSANSAGTPPPAWFLDIVIALAVLTVVSIAAVIMANLQLRRTPQAVIAQATPLARQHRHGTRVHHFPPRHLFPWIVRWTGMLIILFVAVVAVPATVNGVGYLTGAGGTVTFDPVSHDTNCTQYGCDTSTDGVLETGGAGVSATWPQVVPLDKPFRIREPVWRWGLGAALIDSNGLAVVAVVLSLLIEAAAVLVLIRLTMLIRNWLRHRRYKPQLTSASAG